ncbi:hypothetical protein PybrP1_010637 [[Pythium] brassicae (nom. inval.)]|nr:hypothetical protein PybrP1_010637 [[Pythium] brassicae (nom. inval.)]
MAAPVLRVKKLSELALLPSRGSALAAGFDLASAYDAVVPARGKALVKTDLAVAVPAGCYARVAPRSGLALKKFIDTGAGVIDADYRGNVGVVLFNHADEDFEVKRGDRVAQLILEKIEYADVELVDDIEDTERGAGGFGSTGVDNPLKRLRSSDASAALERDVVHEALEALFSSGAIADTKRVQAKKAAFAANERQYGLLHSALAAYIADKDEQKAVEWLDAFLA